MENITTWNGKSAPRIGIGTWVMGGEQYWDGKPTGWAGVDDQESLQTLHTTFDMGVRIIDTANSYGGGHSEQIIARALAETDIPRDEFVICTKVGLVCDQDGNITGTSDEKQTISGMIDDCLKRLQVEQIDLVKFHLNEHPIEQSHGVFEAFSEAYKAGKIAGFGWSNDDPHGALAFKDLDGFVAIQHDLNLFSPADEMVQATNNAKLWSFNRQPLAMGLLTGKYNANTNPFDKDDIRGSGFDWMKYFDENGAPSKEFLDKLDQIKALLTADGRSLAQGALGWCLAQGDHTIPLPGCRTPAQAKDNFGVINYGPLSDDVMEQLDAITKKY